MGAFGGQYAEYVVYLDGVEQHRTTHFTGQDRRYKGSVEIAADVMRDHPEGRMVQIVKHLPKQAQKDKVVYTWRRMNGLWRIVPKHLQQSEAPP